MNTEVARLVERIRDAEKQIEQEFERQQQRWHYRVHRNRVRFEREVRQMHRRLRQGPVSFLRHSSVLNIATAPIIYSLIVPLALIDLWITVYQWTCFPIYGIPRVARRRHIAIDRHKLAYLNGVEKANCVYCGYANGLIAYVREIAARTEQYWCPIRHARPLSGTHGRYHLFIDYGDAEGYHQELPVLRRSYYGPDDEQPPADRRGEAHGPGSTS